MKPYLLVFLTLLSFSLKSQHNFLGKNQSFIVDYFMLDPEYSVNIDTLKTNKVLITCKSPDVYPYHTYEINLIEDKCISYGFVSKNKDILKGFIEILDHIGSIVKSDESFTNFIYMVELPEKKVFYSIRQPFAESKIITRRDLFYVLITEEVKKIKIYD